MDIYDTLVDVYMLVQVEFHSLAVVFCPSQALKDEIQGMHGLRIFTDVPKH